MWNKICSIKATLCYLAFIVLVNSMYPYFPFMTIAHAPFSTGDVMVGAIYIFRDFAQREIKHYVIIAMLIGVTISYCFADKTMAIASVCAFTVAETIDWLIFTYTGKPLSQRLILSSTLSAPADTLVFLAIYGPLNFAGFLVMTSSKALGVLLVWWVWRKRQAVITTPPQIISPGIA
ncbi:MAG TPA: VUT family protein [Gammaproteobacteria bacterium]|nr:VUT family protein [Gammaproteobacteria bacterium]